MLLLLVRHGLTDLTSTRLVGRLPGIGLNARGREQAEQAAGLLATLPVAAIHASPLERTMETAGPLASRLQLAIKPADGLLEVDYGNWAGQEYSALRKTELWKLVQQAPSRARFPGGEAVREAQARIVATIETLLAGNAADTVVAYSHSDMIKLAVAHYVGIPLDLFQRTDVGPGSITALQLTPERAMLLRLGATGTLEDLRPPARRRRKN